MKSVVQNSSTQANSASRLRKERMFWTAAMSASLAALLVIVCLVSWGLNRGFDCQDEAFALVQSRHPDSYQFISSFPYFNHALPHIVSSQICNLRLMHLISGIIGGALLGLGFASYLRRISPQVEMNWQKLICFMTTSAIGNLLGFSTIELSMSYNTLTSLFVCSAAGLSMTAMSISNQAAALSLAAASGVMIGLTFFVKFSASVLLLTLILIFLIIDRGPIAAVKYVGAIIAGMMLGCLWFFSVIEPFGTWSRNFAFCSKLEVTLGSHGPEYILPASIESCLRHGKEIAASVLAIVLLLVGLTRAKTTSAKFKVVAAVDALLVMAFLGLEYKEYVQRSALHSGIVYLVPALINLNLLAVLAGTPKLFSKHILVEQKNLLAVFSLVVLLPFIISLGSNSPIFWHIIGHFGPILLAEIAIAVLLVKSIGKPLWAPLSVVLVGMLPLIQFVSGYVYNPHNMLALTNQTEPITTNGPLQNILVEPAIRKYVDESAQILLKNGYHTGDAVLGIYHGPGLVYALDGYSPGYAWYIDTPELDKENLYYFERLKQNSLMPRFITICNREGSEVPAPNVVAALKHSNIDFAKDFHKVGSVFHPYLYWGGGQQTYLYTANK